MGHYTSAVDLPRPRVDLELGRRRHRRITGPSGLLLFVCLFLPAVKSCGEPVYPLAMPMFWHPYIYGLVLALATVRGTVRHVHYTVIALRILAWLTVVGAALLGLFAAGVALVELFVGALLLAAVGRRGTSERRVAVTTVLVGALSLLWFGLWGITPDAMLGVYLSVGASAGLLVGGLVWLVETS
ncbi:MAG TPA: hypothetical protein VFV99_33830 [Kofleriaceae bacterium]|nr:hypothetical protein [Kofleriaceae bacterium]